MKDIGMLVAADRVITEKRIGRNEGVQKFIVNSNMM